MIRERCQNGASERCQNGVVMNQRVSWSGQQDLNLRPGVPKTIPDLPRLAKFGLKSCEYLKYQ
jgi:hypothetical protein